MLFSRVFASFFHLFSVVGEVIIERDSEIFSILLPKARQIKGILSKGELLSGTIFFEDDESRITGRFRKYCLHGKVFIHSDKSILAIGLYEFGRANGPFWILPWTLSDWQYLFIHFNYGKLIGKVISVSCLQIGRKGAIKANLFVLV